MKRIISYFFVVSFILFTMISLSAKAEGLSASQFRPTSDGGKYLGAWSFDGLYAGEWKLGTFVTYEYRPFQLTAGGSRADGIVDSAFIQHINGSVGLFDKRLAIGLDLPIGWYYDFKDPNVAGSTSTNETNLGDLRINLKSEIFRSRCGHIGLALVPFIDLPTGDDDTFFGNGVTNFGGYFVFDTKMTKGWHVAWNIGLSGREEYDFRDLERSSQLLLSLASEIDLGKHIFLNTEIHSQTRLTGIYSEEVESPTEALAGLKWKIGETGFTLTGGGGAGITYGSASPQYRVYSGLSYSPLQKHLPAFQRAVKATTVHFDSGSAKLKKDEQVKLDSLLPYFANTYRYPVTIVGHTDNRGVDQKNVVLSENRAKAVKQYLESKDVSGKRLYLDWFGEEKPVDNNTTAEGRAANRRVNFSNRDCLVIKN
jgi:outer membrane protein OmpA-like peptidoglycan-associated protein